MKLILISSCLLVSAINLYCQLAPGFNLRFITQYPNSQIYKLLVEDDTIITLGIGCKDTINWERGLVLMKLDSSGNLLHAKHIPDSLFGGPNPLLLHIRYGSLLKTPDGGYIMNIVPFLFAHPVVLKTDHNFNIEFIKEYDVMSEGVDYMLSELKPVSDGYLLHGSFKRSNGMSDGFVGKINFEGDSIWMQNYGNFGSDETVVDVNVINDSTFVVSMIYVIGMGSGLSNIKIINQYGDILQTWNSEPEPEIGYLRDIVSADENGYLVYGLYQLEFLPPITYVVQSTISRLDKDFNLLWSKRYGKEVTLSSEIMFYNFDRTIDGNFIAAGRTSTVPTFQNGPTYERGWLMKFSPEGDSIWSRQDTSDLLPWHILHEHRFGGVGVLSSGSIVAGGYARHLNDYYAWLIKVTNDGCLDTLYCGLVNGVREEEGGNARQEVAVYPNPANDMLTVEPKHAGSAGFEVLIFDATGKIQAAGIGIGKAVLSVQSLPSGIYLMALKFPDGKVLYEKIIVLH